MNKREIKIGNKVFTFLNEFKGNRSGFKHITTMFDGNIEVAKVETQYYNRTWEKYEYQNSMKKCVRALIEELENQFKNLYKQQHNIKRLTKEKNELMLEELKNNKGYIMFNELLTELDFS